jgi:hypothetical protein
LPKIKAASAIINDAFAVVPLRHDRAEAHVVAACGAGHLRNDGSCWVDRWFHFIDVGLGSGFSIPQMQFEWALDRLFTPKPICRKAYSFYGNI